MLTTAKNYLEHDTRIQDYLVQAHEECQEYLRQVDVNQILGKAGLQCLFCSKLGFTNDDEGETTGLYCQAEGALTGPEGLQLEPDLVGARQLYELNIDHSTGACEHQAMV